MQKTGLMKVENGHESIAEQINKVLIDFPRIF